MVGGSLKELQVTVKLVLALATPSLTVSVILAEPN